ncbi:TIR domain-containing protein [Actinoplanes sp. N902-109]|uniref:TIR domain-containing protein n=1 Tax=Actinoplanes sp. (strain N902-109) TaxID=649831 RepID=UPI0003294913|nr:TIR domain-containing protein [Actinoplanes sp. N902-109]AGL21542.1 hypothetical protein L083_8032 [Actinoplanes sp. N902-109]
MTVIRAFLSYRLEDLPARREFETEILSGVSCQLVDMPSDDAVDDWRRRYQEMIADVCGVIVLVGSRTAASEPIRWEIEEAARRNKRIVAVRIHDGPFPLPEGLAEWPVLDWDAARMTKELETWLPTAPTATMATTIWTGTPG